MDIKLADLFSDGLDNLFYEFWNFVKPYTIQILIGFFILILLKIFVKKIVKSLSVLAGYSSSQIKKNEKRAGIIVEFFDFLFSFNKKH